MAGMAAPTTLVGRARVYSGDAIKAIWRAADQLDALESGYVKLVFLTALRREELAQARWSEFDRKDKENPTLKGLPY
jgi:integrase